jgi:HAD superfamily hydrolase (TIGR01662 family)
MELFHNQMLESLSKESSLISLIVVCPHAPDFKGLPICQCRKPRAGMLLAAMNYFDVKRESTIMIGDKETDLMSAKTVGIRGVNVKEFNNFLDCCVKVL